LLGCGGNSGADLWTSNRSLEGICRCCRGCQGLRKVERGKT